MILKKIARIENKPLQSEKIAIPEPGRREIRIKISSCGVCHTDLDEIEGRLKSILPVVPGHQVIGKVEKNGSEASKFNPGDRVAHAQDFLGVFQVNIRK